MLTERTRTTWQVSGCAIGLWGYERCAVSELTSMELKAFPLYASANSEAKAGVLNLSKTMDRFGAESLTVVVKTAYYT